MFAGIDLVSTGLLIGRVTEVQNQRSRLENSALILDLAQRDYRGVSSIARYDPRSEVRRHPGQKGIYGYQSRARETDHRHCNDLVA